MRELAALLAGGVSTLQPLVRLAALGFRAQLAEILRCGEDDPAAAGLRAILTGLDDAMGSGLPAVGVSHAPPLTEIIGAATPFAIGSLAARWASTPEGKSLLLPESPPPSQAALYLLTWRVAPAVARAWRSDWLKEYVGSGGTAVVGPFDELLVPGEATLSATAPLPAAFPAGGALTARLARVISAAVWFAENDPGLRLCLQSAYRFGFAPMTEANRRRYATAAHDRLERFADAEVSGAADDMLHAFIGVDEVVHSLVHQPLAHPQSSYARIGQACRGMLAEVRDAAARAGHRSHAQVIAGGYADALRLTEKDDLEGQGPGVPGDVAHCCRLYLSLDGDVHPGRVIYKPR